jgi:hypothetical protein
MMNVRSDSGVFAMRIIIASATLVVVLLTAVAGRPSLAQETQESPQEGELAKDRGLRVPPPAAGRDKLALIAEAEATQPPTATQPAMNLSELDCGACHQCDNPIEDDPCLRMCPRSVAEVIADAAHETLPKDVILLDAFEWQARRFMPVPFNHKLHADMAGMAGGCQVCHHHTAIGQLHPPCKTCHQPVFARGPGEEMRMPSLKGAYHRQCMGCHRDWSHSTKCVVCHLPKGDQQKPETLDELPPVPGHPPIENPEHIVHKTEYEPGPHVVFRHQEHIELYGYECARCHKGQTCSRCHEQAHEEAPPPTTRPSREERHGACFPCHEDDNCERCHSKTEHPEPQRFDHALVGFALGRYHSELACRACHKRLFFIRKLQGECTLCHTDWEPSTFNHAVTGQALDENHAETDCEECHADRKFDEPPRCDECHDEDEGIAFPDKRPGPVVKDQPAPAGGSRAPH